MHRVLVTANAFAASGPEAAGPLRQAGVEVVHAPRMGPLREEEVLPLLDGVDALIASNDAYTARVLAAVPRLKAICRWGVGLDGIDLDAATARGIVVTNTPGGNTQAVADYVLGLMLNVARPLCEGRSTLSAGGWRERRGVEVWEKTLGIVGFGAIGRAVCQRARGFAMRVLAYDPYAPSVAVEQLGAEPTPLADLLARSDFVTLHASLTPETKRMIAERELRAMKTTAFLINAGRGDLVDEDALRRALDEGWIAGAGLDCFSVEPLPPGHPLAAHPRCFATPHNAFNTVEAAARINHEVVEQVLDVLQGRRPRHVVNPRVYERAVPGR